MIRQALCLKAVAAAFAAVLSVAVAAQEPASTPAAGANPGPAAAAVGSGGEAAGVTRHALMVDGKELHYTATVGFLPIHNEANHLQARIFYVAYVKDGEDPSTRPITFAFNGGPGAASVWLHLGAMGPRRVLLADDGTTRPKGVELVDNQFTWLRFTDLVFIDPVGTGYSAAAKGVDPEQFYSVKGDVQSVGEFIRLYVSRFGRWSSPKFLAGESYGTTRAAGLARRLQEHSGMDLDGLVLVSSALSFDTFVFTKDNDLSYMLYLPTYTAVAWYHHKLGPDMQKDLQAALDRAEEWALDEYGPALARGSKLSQGRRKEIVDGLRRFTGLSAEYIERNNLRIAPTGFAKELLRDKGLIVGYLDGRVTGHPIDPTVNSVEYDPSMALVRGTYVPAIQEYLRTELDFRTDQRYMFLSREANESWQWGSASEGFVSVTGDLQRAMTVNPKLKVLACMGCYDMTTGYFGQQYTYSHLGLSRALQANIKTIRYPSGHQIYTQHASLKKLCEDAANFIQNASDSVGKSRQSDPSE